ncbi:MAG: 2-phospho-L-lactate transferase, partial [SAR324 cluster bacterium]|nr:2-phospho-L-lactate transferase [SAR324 cluster bacterium]
MTCSVFTVSSENFLLGSPESTILALSGGIGGAKLALGLTQAIPPEKLMIVGNIGDDFVHCGLHISPDLDTLMYTLSGKSDPEKGWGLAGESWAVMQAMEDMGGETWFQLGDRDLATHLERTRRLSEGDSLSDITTDFCHKFGIDSQIIPASNDSVRTIVETTEGDLSFQNYFVQNRCQPIATGLRFQGADKALPHPEFIKILQSPFLKAVLICPSNPFLSIDPILAVQGVREALRGCSVPVIAVSPIIGSDSVKGPTAKYMRELGLPVSATAVANYYSDFLDGFILDTQDEKDASEIRKMSISVKVAEILMKDLATKTKLANTVLDFSNNCSKRSLNLQKNGL